MATGMKHAAQSGADTNEHDDIDLIQGIPFIAGTVGRHGEVIFGIVRITATLARQWLLKNINNRRITHSYVAEYIDTMRASLWGNDYTPIRFDRDDRLCDGQKRLTAVIESGVSIEQLVVINVPLSTADYLDTNQQRSAAQALERRGVDYPGKVATAARLVHCLSLPADQFEVAFKRRMGVPKILKSVEEHRGLKSCVHQLVEWDIGTIMPVQIAAALWYVMQKKDKDSADEFWRGVAEGTGLKKNQPAHTLRNTMIDNHTRTHKLPREGMFGVAIDAWNCLQEGKPCPKLVWTRRRKFPEIL